MKPAPFDYVRAESLGEALQVLAKEGADARVIAGGQSLMPMLAMRLAKPAVLVDVMRLKTHAAPALEGDAIVVPAAVRQAALLAWAPLRAAQPLLAAALPCVGHYQTRARGTVCGSVAHADPSAEIPLCLVAAEGEIRLRSRKRARRVPAADFFAGMMMTERQDDELVEAVAFPKARAGAGYAFAEVGRRQGDFAIVACAAVVDAARMRLAVGGVADRPTARDWPLLDGSAIDDALNELAGTLDARDDVHASARYRRELVRRLGRQVLEEARSCSG
jgi:2-furoyl-CoA dehydrogenase FAD binding subunit